MLFIFKLVTIRGNERKIDPFFHLSLLTKVCNILHHKSVRAMVPPYLKDQSIPNI